MVGASDGLQLTFQDGWLGRSRRIGTASEAGLEGMGAIVRRLTIHGRVGGSEGWVDGGAVEVVVVRRGGAGRRSRGCVAGVGSGRIALRDLRAILRRSRGGRGGGRDVGLVRRCVGSRLEVGGAWLLLEDGIVAHALALALLTVATHGMGFVALQGREVSWGQ